MGWIAGADQLANSDARYHDQQGLSCGCEHDTKSARNPKTKPAYEVINDCADRDDESDAQAAMQVEIERRVFVEVARLN